MSKTIEDILKDMPLDEAAKTRLKESWDKALADAKVAQEAQLRESLSKRYDGDLEKIHKAFELFLEERIKPHVAELQEGVQSVEVMKQKYAAKTANIKEAAQDYVRRRLGAIEHMIETRLKSELTELHDDVVVNRRAMLQAITEKRNELESDRQKFQLKATKVLEHIVNITVPKQLEPLREDIEAARRDNFGREIFEAFQTVFRRQFFNTSSEFGKLIGEISNLKEQKETIKKNATRVITESRESATAAQKAYSRLNESVTRAQAMDRLLKPLSGTARAQMKSLLEATKTEKLDETFRKTLPQLVRESKATAPVRKDRESTVQPMEFRSGGTNKLTESEYDPFDDEVRDIQRRAGTKK